MIEEALKAILTEDGGINAAMDGRWYPVQLPDAPTYPCGVITKPAGVGNYHMQGDTGLERARIQLDLYGEAGQSALLALKSLVRRKLSGFQGGQEGQPCQIDSCFCINDFDSTEPTTERAGPRLRRRTLEFEIWHREL